MARVTLYRNWQDYSGQNPQTPLWAFSTRGKNRYDQVTYSAGDGLLFGPESRGLPAEMLQIIDNARILRLPMQSASRSLNLSNTVAIALYEALRQQGFAGLEA
jgi:tRNA(Leu) C34 or U34 (ribose-2'-O)-methylase TrmL